MADNYTLGDGVFRAKDTSGVKSQVMLVGAHTRTYMGVQSVPVTGTVAVNLSVPSGATHADVTMEGAASTDFVRYWHGATDPTSSAGAKLKDGESLTSADPATLTFVKGAPGGGGTVRVEYFAWDVADTTTPIAPVAPSAANYTIPGGATVVTTQGGLDTALAGGTAIDIKVMNGTYSRATKVSPAAAHRIWCESASGVTFNYSWEWGYKSNWQMHGGVYNVPDLAHATSSGAVIEQWQGSPANASGGVVTDATIDGASVVTYGISIRCPHNAVVQRCVISNVTDMGVFLHDNTAASTAVVLTVSDIDVAGVHRSTRGAADGTAEAGLWFGHKVANGVHRIKVRDTGWMGINTTLQTKQTTFSDLDIDVIYGVIPAGGGGGSQIGKTWGVAFYMEKYSKTLVIENFDFGPDITIGVNMEWDGGVVGDQASDDAIVRNGIINCSQSRGTPFPQTGVYCQQGTLRPTITGVSFLGCNSAAIHDQTGNPIATSAANSTLVQSGNTFSQSGPNIIYG